MPGITILLDQNAPAGLRRLLTGYEVSSAAQMGWSELANGDLIRVAGNAGFTVMVTADRNLRYQQNLTARRIAIVELTTAHWPTIRNSIVATIGGVQAGGFAIVELPKPALRRRPWPPG